MKSRDGGADGNNFPLALAHSCLALLSFFAKNESSLGQDKSEMQLSSLLLLEVMRRSRGCKKIGV